MNVKNKILFLLHIPPPVHGSSVVGLSIKSSKVINSAFECEYINLLASQDIAESGTVNSKKLMGFAVTLVKLFTTLKKFHPDLCYLALTTTGAAFFKDIFIVVLLKIFNVKRIYHLHNRGVSLKRDNTFYRICYKFVFRKAEVILLSKRLYHDIQEFIDDDKVYICPNGINDFANIYPDQPNIEEKHKKETGVWENRDQQKITQLLFLSNLIESKGVFDLIEACAILKEKQVPFKCTFIGGESDISAAQFNNHITKYKLEDYVVFEGRKYNKEKEMAFKNADIFVFPTFYSNECFPLVLLEAMSYSLPVVSTFEGGIQDIVEINKTGLLIKQRDINDLANKLEYLIKNPELYIKMGISGRLKYEREFTMTKFETRLEKILSEIISNN